MSFDENRFAQLVHYICYRCETPQQLGKTKLNKILWFSDMLNFERTGKPLTGETYVKLQFGPVPKHIDEAIGDLQSSGKLSVRLPQQTYDSTLFFATEAPDLSGFTADEISLVDRLIETISRNHTATSISRVTHDDIYELAEMGEEIPYEAFLAAELGDVTVDDFHWAQKELQGGAR
jgi:uncharacterized phage-associated protein